MYIGAYKLDCYKRVVAKTKKKQQGKQYLRKAVKYKIVRGVDSELGLNIRNLCMYYMPVKITISFSYPHTIVQHLACSCSNGVYCMSTGVRMFHFHYILHHSVSRVYWEVEV